MQFDPVMLNMLLQQSDEELWKSIQKIASKNGLKISDKAPSPEEIQKLRRVLSGAEKMDPREARRIINSMKKGGGRHE